MTPPDLKTKITDLPAADSFSSGDLVWLRKSGSPYDHKITFDNFLNSIGNTAVKGFSAISEEANKLTLIAATGIELNAYYNNMTVSFVSTINSNGVVQIKINNLPYVNFLKIGTNQTVVLEAGKYYEAIFSENNIFYQTNIIEPTFWSNEYEALATIDPQGESTLLSLTSAIGATKTNYYKNMSLIFTCPLNTRGALLVNVDNLGIKQLKDPDGDLIADDLDAGEAVFAIYNGSYFIKHMFSTVEPPAPPLPVDPEVPVPDVNLRSVTVGPNRPITNVESAINQFVREFGENGSNHLCTINLASDYIWVPVTVNTDANLSWITIKSTNDITTSSLIFVSPLRKRVGGNYTGTFPTINGRFVVNLMTFPQGYQKYSIYCHSNVINLDGSFFTVSFDQARFNSYLFYVITGGALTVNKSTISGPQLQLSQGYLPISCENAIFRSSECVYQNIVVLGAGGHNITLEQCAFTLSSSSYPAVVGSRSGNVVIRDCTFNCNQRNKTIWINGGTAELTNVVVNATSGSESAVYVNSRTQVVIDGGNFSMANPPPSSYDIIADGDGTIVILRNNVIGTYLARNGGRIVVE